MNLVSVMFVSMFSASAPTDSDIAKFSSADNIQSLKQRVAQVKDLRTQLDEVREKISDKYAEYMGDMLTCHTQ